MASEPPESDPEDRRSGGFDDTMPAAMPLMESSSVGGTAPAPSERYRLGVELGRGGMGRVVEAFDIQLGRTVALKEALPRGGHGTYRRFAREIQITARLEHASIVPLYDSGTTPDGRPYYVMRRVSGRPFDELILRARGLGERLTLLPALKAAIDAIGHAHKRGVIHRDLKPANILVGELGETVVIDWGLAKVVGEEDLDESRPPSRDSVPADMNLQTQVGSVFGTPGFMAPEQARGEELGPRGDVYALGATLYQMLTGVPPYGGKSATEVIDRNRKAEIKPIAEAAPEAPRELIAIVHKSLAANPEDRYPNAGALAEDVRRFLDGQLVAAHRYTRTQRLRRFARRNRAPLVVAALAAACVAGLSWFSVHRVLQERATAVEGRRVAEERAEALIVARARSLIDANPTQALATLKQLRVGSPYEPDARGIAQAAVARGVAWGIDDDATNGNVLFPVLSPNGSRLVVVSLDGHLRVYDTDSHQLLLDRTYDRGTHAVWVHDASSLFVYGGHAPSFIIDPATGATTATPLGIVSEAVTDARGDRIVCAEWGDKAADVYDVASGKVTQLWTGAHVQSETVAPDGSWIAIGGDKEVAIYDATGREVARKEVGAVVTSTASRDRRLAVLTQTEVWEYDVDHSVWTEIPTGLPPTSMLLHIAYRGDVLVALATNGELREWHGVGWVQRMQLEQIGSALMNVGSDLMVIAGGDGRMHWVSAATIGTLALPAIVTNMRISGSSDSSRLVVAGANLVLVYDLRAMSPKRLDNSVEQTFAFLDNDTVLFWTNSDPWTLLRTKTGQRIKFDVPWIGIARLDDSLPEEGRAMFQYFERNTHLIEIRDEAQPLHHIAAVPPAAAVEPRFVGKLLPGGGTVFASDSSLQATIGDGRPYEVVRMDGDVTALARLGHLAYGAVSTHGDLVRGTLESKQVDHAHIPASDQLSAGSYEGKLVVGTGTQVLLWEGADVTEIAHFQQPVDALLEVVGGIGVRLADGRVMDLYREPGAGAGAVFKSAEILPRGSEQVSSASSGGVLIARGNNALLNVVELPSRVRWTMPIQPQVDGTIVLAPSSGQIVEAFSGLVTWTLPRIEGDLHAWLDLQTNAVEDADEDLAWPWQQPQPTQTPDKTPTKP